jgi:hypothetical protein
MLSNTVRFSQSPPLGRGVGLQALQQGQPTPNPLPRGEPESLTEQYWQVPKYNVSSTFAVDSL